MVECNAGGRPRRRMGLLPLVLAAACAEPPTTTEPYAPARRLEGEWRWLESLDVRTTALHTPGSAGFDARITFTALANRSGNFLYERSGAPAVHGGFAIGSEHAPGNDFIAISPAIDFLTSHAWLGLGTDTLRLGGVMEMGYNSRYVRVR